MQTEFEYVKKYLTGYGVDVGCGTNRLSPAITSVDQQSDKRYAHADIVWDCKDLECFKPDEIFDFIFSSHCLEDFEDIPSVFVNWWKKLKPGGFMVLLLPDMEDCHCSLCVETDLYKKGQHSRYAKVEEKDKFGGNPAHRTNVGKVFINQMLTRLSDEGKIKFRIDQIDTVPHNVSCTIDVVIQKEKS